MYVRTVKVKTSAGAVHEYVRIVEAQRVKGKVKQRVVANLGRKDVLADLLPMLQKVLAGDAMSAGTTTSAEGAVKVREASTWGPVLLVRTLFEELGLFDILDRRLGRGRGVPYADRVLALVANRLTRPASEHGIAEWLETDFVCTRDGRRFVPKWLQRGRVRVDHRQLQQWYRTLDRLLDAKETIEVDLYHRLRDLFSLQPDLVFYDITSLYFQGAGPEGFARHGHSRDGKPRNPQVVVGMLMVNGWPIAHHVFAGNMQDHATVTTVVEDLRERFGIGRFVFVGDRGMVSARNLEELTKHHECGYLLGVKRRRNQELHDLLDKLTDEWIECPVGITASEQTTPPRTRVQEVAGPDPEVRILVIDSEERKLYEEKMRSRAMERTRVELEKLQARVAKGRLKDPAKIGAAAQRVLSRNHGNRYYAWQVKGGQFLYFEHPVNLEREKRIEGKYVIMTTEPDLAPVEAVRRYKELNEVERGFRDIKNLIDARPIHHRTEDRTRAHVFVAALAFLVDRLLERRLRAAGSDLTSARALRAVETIRHVTFDLGKKTSVGVTTGSQHAQGVLRALGITDRRPPAPKTSGETVM
jgi:transposase